VGSRSLLFLFLGVLGAWSYLALDISIDSLAPGAGGLELASKFFGRALTPALYSEAQFVPAGTPPLLIGALHAAWTTTLFAAAAMSLSIVAGLALGFLASAAWWVDDPAGGSSASTRFFKRIIAPSGYLIIRALITVLRSVHELLWAILFLAAIGLSETGAILAIAIPTTGTLAKVFSETIDETPRNSAMAMRSTGASQIQVYFFGLLPRALPDLIAYSFYRFECALRSSAILGFFGFPTLGLYIRQSFSSTNYGEVWTYLYVLIALVVAFDMWSGAIRKRIIS
jgi:phosphonate transport system permease protein